jgi:riboflavin kinase / FMN adenylyltransferase
MEVIYLKPHQEAAAPFASTICLGNFDGFHRGHQKLVIDATLASQGPCAVLLFDENPADFIKNGKSHSVISSLEDKIRLLRRLRVDIVYVVHVDQAFFDLSAEEFIADYLLPLHIKKAVVGSDFRFGKGAKGTPEDLEKHFEVLIEGLAKDRGGKISTSRIKILLEKGKIEEANGLLGRDYEIHGKVIHGLHNGTKLGFPTANIDLKIPYVLPKSGVYEGLAFVNGIPHQALVNIGTNPTIGVLTHPSVEVYLDGFSGDLYGETLYLDFVSFMRDEIVFDGLEALKAQLEKDKKRLREKYR